jgi:hypothetical protein
MEMETILMKGKGQLKNIYFRVPKKQSKARSRLKSQQSPIIISKVLIQAQATYTPILISRIQ